jgi:hypothetical protein
MLRIDRANKKLVALERKTLREGGYWERRDIQEMICRTPNSFCEELGEYIHIVGTEVQPADFVQDRIDLLGVDSDGVAVIIELKRDSHKLQLLQSLSYAGMIAKWEPKRFIEHLTQFNNNSTVEEAKEQLEEILEEGEVESINRSQRIVLLAEAFDYEVLVTAEWLTERYDLDVRCYRLALAENGPDQFLTCTRAYPPPELTDLAISRRRRREIGEPTTMNWDEALKSVENKAVVQFFREELGAARSNNPKSKNIRFSIGGKRRFVVYAKRRFARVWQSGRFDGDLEFWKSRVSDRGKVDAMEDGRRLRFYLFEDSDFRNFKHAVTNELSHMEFHRGSEEEQEETDRVAE